ncbi:MAG: acyl-CoA desaturase [Alphaproteobacteria bacterium]|nr:acyl-CoA desaturase [Alphaproteobacteria bacterium]
MNAPIESEASLKARLRADLPPETFARNPWRALLIVPQVVAVVGGSAAILFLPLPWYVALLIALALGNTYAGLMFFGHEITHGATVASRRLQNALLYPCFAIFFMSPELWRAWHNKTHHPNTNIPGKDPDNFGTLEQFNKGNRTSHRLIKFAPGSGHWSSAFYMFCSFALQGADVLWRQSLTMPSLSRLNRRRAITDSVLMAAFWIALGIAIGLYAALFVIIIPMIVANTIVMSYFVTNHMLRPLTYEKDSLGTTISVRTPKIIDRLHFHSGHHVEHHLFPGMRTSRLPLIREGLLRHAPERYIAPPHWLALVMVSMPARL